MQALWFDKSKIFNPLKVGSKNLLSGVKPDERKFKELNILNFVEEIAQKKDHNEKVWKSIEQKMQNLKQIENSPNPVVIRKNYEKKKNASAMSFAARNIRSEERGSENRRQSGNLNR